MFSAIHPGFLLSSRYYTGDLGLGLALTGLVLFPSPALEQGGRAGAGRCRCRWHTLPLLGALGLDQSMPAPAAFTVLAMIYALLPCVFEDDSGGNDF